MKIGMVGLGRMGANMSLRLFQHGHEVVAFDHNPQAVKGVASEGGQAAGSLEELVGMLEPPRAVWVMLPAGDPTEGTVARLEDLLAAGDVIIDGGNSKYTCAIEDADRLASKGIAFVDAGVSGGVWGLKNGYCLMVGGDAVAVKRLEEVFCALAPEGGFAHVGPVGSGHFVKMIHNGIEYGMLQAYAEGFSLLDRAEEFHLDLHQVAEVWRYGSVVRSWLLDLAALAFANKEEFSRIKGYVDDSGEGRWTVEEAINRSVSAPVITASLFERFSSRQPDSFAARIVAALRNEFGGHRFLAESAGARAAADAASDASPDGEGVVSPEGSATESSGGSATESSGNQ
jgi:6-phosphogluconate dehydrogenase